MMSMKKDIGTFKMNVQQGYAPKESTMSCEGVFAKYYFDIGKTQAKALLETPIMSACSTNPMNGQLERFLGFGLVGSEDGKSHRDDLNLVIVLDISGSMSEPFTGAKLDIFEDKKLAEKPGPEQKSKIDVAKFCVCEIIKKMKKNERLGIILFNSTKQILQPLRDVSYLKIEDLLNKVSEISANSGTNMQIGFETAVQMLKDQVEEDTMAKAQEDFPKNNRIIFLTDACPNIGEKLMLKDIATQAAKDEYRIYTTYIGIGLDFNTDLVNELTKVQGSNYFSVQSEKDFIKTLTEDFNYIVTPIVFDAQVSIESGSFEIEKTFGSPFDDEEKHVGPLLKMETIIASDIKPELGVKGGIVLAQVKPKLPQVPMEENKKGESIKIILSYKEKSGACLREVKEVSYDMSKKEEFYETAGIRKAILLSRYVTLIRGILKRLNAERSKEEQLLKMKAYDEMKEEVSQFKKYFLSEMKALNDPQLNEELDSLDCIKYS